MASSSVYLTPEFKKSYQAKTGKTLSAAVVDSNEYSRLAGEVGGSTPSAADRTFLGATRTNSGVSIDGASPLSNPALKGGALGADRISAVAGPSAQVGAGTIITQRDSNPNTGLRGAVTPGATVTANADGTISERSAAPAPRGPAGNPAISQASAPVKVEPQRDPGSLAFQEWLEAMGFTLPKVPEFAFDPNAAYQAALGEAELEVAPQREALMMQTDRTLRDRQTRAASQQAALRESQARRRLFTSPVGAFLEQENQRMAEQGIRDVEADRDMRLRGFEAQKATRAMTHVQTMQRDSYANYAKAVAATQQQFDSLVSLYDKTMDNIRADRKDANQLAKDIADIRIREYQAETAAGQLDVSAGRLELDAKKYALDAQKEANGLLKDWAKTKAENLRKFGPIIGLKINQALDAAMNGDEETAERLLLEAGEDQRSSEAAKELASESLGVFKSTVAKYGPNVATYIVMGMQAKNADEQQQWFDLADSGIASQLQAETDAKLSLEQVKQAAQTERLKLQQEGANKRAALQARSSARRSYTSKFGPEAAALMLDADELEEEGLFEEAAAARQEAMVKAEPFLNKPQTNESQAWKGFMSDVKAQESAALYNAALQKNMKAVVQALVQKWEPSMTDEEVAALEAYLKARGWLD